MLQHKIYEIDSTNDLELGIKRESKLEFRVSYDDERPMKALFVFISGIRNEDYAGYEQHLAEFVVQTYDLAVLRVDYHCIGFRPQTGASFYMDKKDKEIFAKQCKEIAQHCDIDISLPEGFLEGKNLEQNESYGLLSNLDQLVASLKQDAKKVPQDYQVPLTITLKPTKNEYQNFGFMQALDVLNAICFVRKNYAKFKLDKRHNTLLLGSSHGGYLALLCAKFAPWLIDAVVENSGYANTPLRFLGFGKELDYTNCFETATGDMFENLAIFISTKTKWSGDPSSKNAYTFAHDKIRSLPEKDHLLTQAKCKKTVFVSYHSAKDDLIALPAAKIRLYELLKELGYEARLNMIQDESEIDGKFIKDLSHGMRMSLKTLIKKEIPPLIDRKFTKAKTKEIMYESENLSYHFKEGDLGIECEIKRLN